MNITQNSPKHFIDLSDFNLQTLRLILDNARNMKNQIKNSDNFREEQVKILPHKILAMIFEKSSTRTRVSFEVGVVQLGGTPLILSAKAPKQNTFAIDLSSGMMLAPSILALYAGPGYARGSS